jgi:spermidine synthase
MTDSVADSPGPTPYSRLLAWVIVAVCALPAVAAVCSPPESSSPRPGLPAPRDPWTSFDKAVDAALLGIGGLALAALAWRALRRLEPAARRFAAGQAEACDVLSPRLVGPAVLASSAVCLFLELAVIRWHGTLFELFAYYKNLSLLACFLGLGLGYARARGATIPLVYSVPLFALQAGLLLFMRYGLGEARRASLSGLPVTEQLSMGVHTTQTGAELFAVYAFLAVVFLLTTLFFIPIGQLCGRLMNRSTPLRAYGVNLVGSALGVAAMLLLSQLQTPPAVWFALGLGALLPFLAWDRHCLLASSAAFATVQVLLSLPVAIGWEQIYSPYQLLERGPGEHGLSLVRAAGQYYQRIHNLSDTITSTTNDEGIRLTAAYYELPYHAMDSPSRRVLIVGAGTGNDVAAALRRGADHVDAVEIDPAIIQIGREFHPESPYQDPQVEVVIDDARTFLRTTDARYDLIVYGLLDSHTLLSHAANVRLDSFVYTVEALREARSRLTPGGVLALSFSVLSPELGRKIYRMLETVFDGRPPLCLRGWYSYDGSVVFLESENPGRSFQTKQLEELGFRDVTSIYADPALHADLSTDDWPFFYMPRRVYPKSYLGMVALILGLAIVLVATLIRQGPAPGGAVFFFLGAGFMLLQTKAVTELGLAFGNTWQLVGLAILGMLAFAFLANLVVAETGLMRPLPPFLLLIASLVLGLAVASNGGLPPTLMGRIGTLAILTGPVFFSGLVFSALLARVQNLSGALASNLLGALVGGLLEYNSMYFGFRFLYVVVIVLYTLALLASVRLPAAVKSG